MCVCDDINSGVKAQTVVAFERRGCSHNTFHDVVNILLEPIYGFQTDILKFKKRLISLHVSGPH